MTEGADDSLPEQRIKGNGAGRDYADGQLDGRQARAASDVPRRLLLPKSTWRAKSPTKDTMLAMARRSVRGSAQGRGRAETRISRLSKVKKEPFPGH